DRGDGGLLGRVQLARAVHRRRAVHDDDLRSRRGELAFLRRVRRDGQDGVDLCGPRRQVLVLRDLELKLRVAGHGLSLLAIPGSCPAHTGNGIAATVMLSLPPRSLAASVRSIAVPSGSRPPTGRWAASTLGPLR